MSDNTLLLQVLAAILKVLAGVSVDTANLWLISKGLLVGFESKYESYAISGLVAVGLAAALGLRLKQRTIPAVHADAVVGLEIPPAAGRHRAARKTETEEKDGETHFE